MKGFLALVAGCAVLAARAASDQKNIWYVPDAGTGPYAWTTVGNWYHAGAPYDQLPGENDCVYLQTNLLANQTVVLDSGTTASLYKLYFGAGEVPVTLEVEDGATLVMNHSSLAAGPGSVLHVKSGGLVRMDSFFSFGAGDDSDVRLKIDEGSTYVQSANRLSAPSYRNAKAVIENSGLFAISNSSVSIGYTSAVSSKSTGYGFFDNYGRVTSDSHNTPRFEIGAASYVKGYLTNRVDAVIDLNMPVTVGGSSNATGYVCNYGTFKVGSSRLFGVGGDLVSSTSGVTKVSKASKGYVHNYGTMNLATLNVGNWRYCTGEFTNHSNATLNVSGALQMSYKKYAVGKLTLEEGSTNNVAGNADFGMYGPTTVMIGGDFRFTDSGAMRLATYDQATSTVTIASTGYVKGAGMGLYLAAGSKKDGGDATFEMVGNAVYENPGFIYMATGSASRATMTLSDNARIDGATRLYVGVGNASAKDPQAARCELRDNAQFTNFNGHVYIAANAYGTGELILADKAKISRKQVSPTGGHNVYIASSKSSSSGRLTLRGGTLQLTTNSAVYVGHASTNTAACNGLIRGWGTIDRIFRDTANGSDFGCNLQIHCGAAVADGEGEERDLDLSVFRKVNTGGLNNSGTNGWYAINKGRLYYPCRNKDYVNLGDYYDRAAGPYFVNGVKFAFTGAANTMMLHGQLYATDRDDIPEGLPADDAAKGVRRLGVWRAGLFTTSFSERVLSDDPDVDTVDFTKATATIRYDNFRLDALKDETGAFAEGQKIRLYRHTGTKWVRVASRAASEAESDHTISGEILPVEVDGSRPVSERWNMGFFAVVAERNEGLTVIIR